MKHKYKAKCEKCEAHDIIIKDFYIADVYTKDGRQPCLVIDFICPCGNEGANFVALKDMLGIESFLDAHRKN